MKPVEEHRWALSFEEREGFSVYCLDPCPEGEQREGDRVCSCLVGLEEPTSELVGSIEVGLQFRHECWGHVEGGLCDCDWYFDITSARLMEPAQNGGQAT